MVHTSTPEKHAIDKKIPIKEIMEVDMKLHKTEYNSSGSGG